MKRLSIVSPLLLLTAALLPGQTTPLSFRVQVSGTAQTLADNGTVQFTADAIGKLVGTEDE